MHRSLTAFILGFVLLMAMALSLSAAPQCAPRESVTDTLTGRYAEAPRMRGLAGSGVIVELWANGDSGSWTILVTRPDGISCLVASGTAYTPIAPLPAGEPA